MFSNLSKGSILHGVEYKNGDMKWFTASVERITPSLNNQYPNSYGQFPALNLDIVAMVDGTQREYKGVHSNDTIADFGQDAFVLADNKDSLYNYIKSLLKTSEDAVDEKNLSFHRKRIPQYRNVLSELRPDVSSASEVKELNKKVNSLESQIAEMLSLLKQGNSKQV